VGTAIQSIYRDLEYAKSLIKRKDGKAQDETVEDSEESWTFIGDDNDPELIKRIYDWEAVTQSGTHGEGIRASSGSATLSNRALSGGPGVPVEKTSDC
jgi:sterol 3beta-glucosyltransferase